MMDVKIDRDDPTLLHDQVAAQIRRAESACRRHATSPP
jgi:hypothetical protein